MQEAIVTAGGAGAAAYLGKVLIDHVALALGGYYRPKQIIKVAEAEAKAALIKATNDAEIENIEHRAMFRHESEQVMHQAHMEAIANKAQLLLQDKADPAGIDPDWTRSFFDKARLVGDTDMQNIWARILAGEANNPGAFSRRTLSIVSDLTKTDAEIFVKVCSLSVQFHDCPRPIFPEAATAPANKICSFEEREHLASLGLINHSWTASFMELDKIQDVKVDYFGRIIVARRKKGGALGYKIPFGIVAFTAFGIELARICNAKPIPNHFEEILQFWHAYDAREFTPKKRNRRSAAI